MSRLLTVLAILPPYPHRQLDLLLGVRLRVDAVDATVEKIGKITTRLRQKADQTAKKLTATATTPPTPTAPRISPARRT